MLPLVAPTAWGGSLVTAWACAAILVPTAHAAGLALCSAEPEGSATAQRRRHGRASLVLHFVLAGGNRHLVLQVLSWVRAQCSSGSLECHRASRTGRARRPRPRSPPPQPQTATAVVFVQALWLCSLMVAVPALRTRWLHAPPTAHTELLSAAAAISAFCSLLFQLKALLVFDPSEPAALRFAARALQAGSSSLAWDIGRLPSRTARAYIVCGIGLLWVSVWAARFECFKPFEFGRLSVRICLRTTLCGEFCLQVGLGGALLLATEDMTDRGSLIAYYCLAAACITTGAFVTHGLAGFLRYAGPSASSDENSGDAYSDDGMAAATGWRFWQPFRGGTAFVLAQVSELRLSALCAYVLEAAVSTSH